MATKKKANKNLPQVSARLDSLTDVLKFLLNNKPGQTVAQLLPQVRERLLFSHSPGKVEKNILRCLEKNPSFQAGAGGAWFLDHKGDRANDPFYQMLQSAGQVLSLSEMKQIKQKKSPGWDPEEIQLVYDGRFLRLADGRWGLLGWHYCYQVTQRELALVERELRQARLPLPAWELAGKVLRYGLPGTDLEAKLEADPRFTFVGGGGWFLTAELPISDPADQEVDSSFGELRLAENAALQEAELMLILNDTDPQVRSYVVSSQDLAGGSLRIAKRMEKLFAPLPALALVTLRTQSGPVRVWYSREKARLYGLGQWFQANGLLPGSRLKVQRVGEDGFTFDLLITGEQVEEVATVAGRLQRLEVLRECDGRERLPLPQLVAEVLGLFPQGLPLSKLAEILAAIRPTDPAGLTELLAQYPFFLEAGEGVWHFEPRVYATYRHLEGELAAARNELKQAQTEAAAYAQQAGALDRQREELAAQLGQLQQHYQGEEGLYQERVGQLAGDNERLRRENQAFRGELERLHQRNKELQEETAEVGRHHKDLRCERDTLRHKVSALENRVVQLQSTLNQTVQDAQAESAYLEQQLRATGNRFEKVVSENEDLVRQLEQLRREYLALKKASGGWLVRLALALVHLFSGRRRREDSGPSGNLTTSKAQPQVRHGDSRVTRPQRRRYTSL